MSRANRSRCNVSPNEQHHTGHVANLSSPPRSQRRLLDRREPDLFSALEESHTRRSRCCVSTSRRRRTSADIKSACPIPERTARSPSSLLSALSATCGMATAATPAKERLEGLVHNGNRCQRRELWHICPGQGRIPAVTIFF